MSEMKKIDNNALIPKLRLDWIAAYLGLQDWREVEDSKHPKARVFQKDVGQGEEPLLVTLPRKSGTMDEERRIVDVLSTLSALQERSITTIAQEIATLHSDVMTWRIPNADADHTIPLNIAADMIAGLCDLLRYGASAESEPRPYFSRVTDIGTRYMKQCRLKPTRPGSFIFEVESPLEEAIPSATEPNGEAGLFALEDIAENKEADDKTFHRRVMERIAQGLQDVQTATVSGVPEQLTEKYEHGFNANLCETLREMLKSVGERGLEFSMHWSPTAEPASVTQTFIRFDPKAIEYLEKAAIELRAVSRAIPVVISGKIIRLGVGSTTRTITIQSNKGIIRVTLNVADYRMACDAHKDGQRIQVTGILQKGKKFQTLTSASDFIVLPPVGTRG